MIIIKDCFTKHLPDSHKCIMCIDELNCVDASHSMEVESMSMREELLFIMGRSSGKTMLCMENVQECITRLLLDDASDEVIAEEKVNALTAEKAATLSSKALYGTSEDDLVTDTRYKSMFGPVEQHIVSTDNLTMDSTVGRFDGTTIRGRAIEERWGDQWSFKPVMCYIHGDTGCMCPPTGVKQ